MNKLRRDFLRQMGIGAASVALARSGRAGSEPSTGEPVRLRDAGFIVRLADGTQADSQQIMVRREWDGRVCRSSVVNHSDRAVAVKEIVLFGGSHRMKPETRIYGESFQMLSQTYGTLGAPIKLGYDEKKHYRIPETESAVTVRSLAFLAPVGRERLLWAFTSCRRFAGEFRFWPKRFEVVLDAEDRTLSGGERWRLEEFVELVGSQREALLRELAIQIERHHPKLSWGTVPTGWCSWYYFGKKLTENDILRNLDAIAKDHAGLRYIQIDDGFQPAHGDWLDPNPDFFPRGIKALCHEIRARGFEPAIWVAPFIAEPASRLLRERPDWFVKGSNGSPLSADQVTFKGWNNAPWYMLDATIREVQSHLERIFRVMREEWGCRYFKLDANFWGAVHGSRYHDSNATRIENYRRGMEAIRRGARDSFILGCNAPFWASLGEVHGMRVTGDISRRWPTIARCARENFFRNWQHGRLWINDPDCVLLSSRTPEGVAAVNDDEFLFHASAVLASGGMLLSGDDYAGLSAGQKAMLRRLLPPTNVAAAFTDERFELGVADLGDGRSLHFVFNWDDETRAPLVEFGGRRHVSDFWTDERLGAISHHRIVGMRPHSARVFLARSV